MMCNLFVVTSKVYCLKGKFEYSNITGRWIKAGTVYHRQNLHIWCGPSKLITSIWICSTRITWLGFAISFHYTEPISKHIQIGISITKWTPGEKIFSHWRWPCIVCVYGCHNSPVSTWRPSFPGMEIPMLKIRRSRDPLLRLCGIKG